MAESYEKIRAMAKKRADDMNLDPPLRDAVVAVTLAEGMYFLEHGDADHYKIAADALGVDVTQLAGVISEQWQEIYQQVRASDLELTHDEAKTYAYLTTCVYMTRIGYALSALNRES